MANCHIYVLGHWQEDGRLHGPCKVGIATCVDGRVAELQTGNPTKIGMALMWNAEDRRVALQCEREFHRRFAHKRLRGEWFDIDPVCAIAGVFQVLLDELEYDVGCDAALLRTLMTAAHPFGPTTLTVPE